MSRSRVAYLSILPKPEQQKLDLTFRLSFLEGVAGLNPGTWTRNPRANAIKAKQWFLDAGFPLTPSWFEMDPDASWAVDLDRRVWRGTERFSSGLKAIGVTREDILNELIKSINSPEGKRQERVYWSFGASNTPEKIQNKPPVVSEVIGPGIARAVDQLINAKLKARQNRPLLQKERELGDGNMPGMMDPVDRAWNSPSSETESRDPTVLLIDLMADEHSLGSAILRMVENVIDRMTKNEVNRFVLKRFFQYMTDPNFNHVDSEDNQVRSQMWKMLNRIRDQVREDMLAQFDPQGTMDPGARQKFLTRIYGILGTGSSKGGNQELPSNVLLVAEALQKEPAIQALLEKFRAERERMTLRTAHRFLYAQWKKALGVFGVWLCERR